MLFGRRNSSAARGSYVPERGLIATPTMPAKSVDFTFDTSGEPAVAVQNTSETPGVLSLTKSYKAATDALLKVKLPGIRFDIIVMLDGSGSMNELYRDGTVEKMLVRTLGFALNVDIDGSIPVFTYGSRTGKTIQIDASNYQDAGKLINKVRANGSTAMTEGLQQAFGLAKDANKLVMIINITDGNPDDKLTMKNEVIKLSAYPIMLKNLAIAPVPFLGDLDDMPSLIEVQKDHKGVPVIDQDKHMLYRNTNGVRFIDSVDSQSVNPFTATDEQFAAVLAEEIAMCVEVMARVGILTNVPGFIKEF